MDKLGGVQQRAVTMIKGLEDLTQEEMPRQLGLFIPYRRHGLGGSYINVCSYVMVKEMEPDSFQ